MNRSEFLGLFPNLAKNYQTALEVKQHIGQVDLLMIIGPTGVGKTTLINKLNVPYVPSDTTRSIRPHERDGLDMFFLKDYGQVVADIKAGKFVQVAAGATGDLYATRDSSYPASGWATMPVMADVVPIFRNLGFRSTLSAFITPPDYAEWMRRLGDHLEPDTLKRRMAEAERSFSFALADGQTHFVLNDELDRATSQIEKLLDGTADPSRETQARAAAGRCLVQLKKQFNL